METTRAGIAIYKINYQSDFILTVVCDVEWGTPFCIKFWTGEPAQAYYVGWDGKEYRNCKVVESDPSKLLVLFDDHHLPVGELKMQIVYHTTIEDFPNAIVDEVTNSMKVMAFIDGKNQKVALDFEGEEAAELQFELPAYANEAQRIANEEQRIANEQQRIANEEARVAAETNRVNEYARLKADVVSATTAANDAATLANQKAQLAADKAALAQQKAQLAADKAALAQQKAEYADEQGNYAKEQGDYAKEQGDTALADHRRAESDHETAATDHTQAATDHTQAGQDHTRAEADHTRAESDHAAVEVYVDSLGAFDISSYHATGGVLAKYADLTAALGTGGANIPEAIRKGGMSVKYVQSSDNIYVQYRFLLSSFTASQFANANNWQRYDDVLDMLYFSPTVAKNTVILNGGLQNRTSLIIYFETSGYGGFRFLDANNESIISYQLNSAGIFNQQVMVPSNANSIESVFGTLTNLRIYGDGGIPSIANRVGQLDKNVGYPVLEILDGSELQVISCNIKKGYSYKVKNLGEDSLTLTTRQTASGGNIDYAANGLAPNAVNTFTASVDAAYVRIGYGTAPFKFILYDARAEDDSLNLQLADVKKDTANTKANLSVLENQIGEPTRDFDNESGDSIIPCTFTKDKHYIFFNRGKKQTFLTMATQYSSTIDTIGTLDKGEYIEFVPTENASYLRIGYYTGTFSFSIYDADSNIGLQDFKTALAVYNLQNKVGIKELPIVAPSPQLPANSAADSDFNAETVTSQQLQSAFENLISDMPTPAANSGYKYPKFGNMYEVIGRDASDTYDIKAYVFGLRNRFAWKHDDKYYAWKNGSTTVYVKSVSPRVGDAIYNSAGVDSGKTVTQYNSATETITLSDSSTYTRYVDGNIDADVVFSSNIGKSGDTTLNLYDKDDTSLGNGTWLTDTTMSYNSKTYTRCESLDWHTNQKATIVIWGNEHAAQSDPAECSIILYRLAKDLCHGTDNKFIEFLRSYCKVVLLPCANPYGMNKWVSDGRGGRTNANGVNINRNYDTVGWSVQADTDKGTYAGDQNETQYIMNLCSAFNADIAIDIHALGYVTSDNEGFCHWEGEINLTNDKIVDVMALYGLKYTSYGNAAPSTNAKGPDWIAKMNITGGLIEMNCGNYATAYNGSQHTSNIMEADYTLLLNTLRMWYYGFDGKMNLMDYNVI